MLRNALNAPLKGILNVDADDYKSLAPNEQHVESMDELQKTILYKMTRLCGR